MTFLDFEVREVAGAVARPASDVVPRTPRKRQNLDQTLVEILESFTGTTKLRAQIVNLNGKPQVVPPSSVQPSKYCQIVRSTPEYRERCYASYKRAGEHAASFGKPYIFRSHCGLIGWAVPVMTGQQHIGTAICGQVLMWEPEDFFWTEVREMLKDLDERSFGNLKMAAKSLPQISAKEVQHASTLLYVVISAITQANLNLDIKDRQLTFQKTQLERERQKRKRLEAYLSQLSAADQQVTLLEERIVTEALNRNWLLLGKLLDDYIDQLEKTKCSAVNKKVRLLELVLQVFHKVESTGYEIDEKLKLNLVNQIQDAKEMSSVKSTVELLWSYLRNNEVYDPSKPRDEKNDLGSIAERVTTYITRNYHKQLTLVQIAKATNFSPHHLSRKFKEQTGYTVMESLNLIRINRVMKLIKESPDQPLKHLFPEVGFNDSSHFTRVFKKYTGLTPSEYRSSISSSLRRIL